MSGLSTVPPPVAKRLVVCWDPPAPPAAHEQTFAALVAVLGHESHRSQEALVNLALDRVAAARARQRMRRV